jgi:hypothetical protein
MLLASRGKLFSVNFGKSKEASRPGDCSFLRPGSRAADGAGSDGSKKLLSAAQVPASGVLSELVGGLADRAANAADQMGDRGFESTSLQRRDGMGQAAKEMAPSSLANN